MRGIKSVSKVKPSNYEVGSEVNRVSSGLTNYDFILRTIHRGNNNKTVIFSRLDMCHWNIVVDIQKYDKDHLSITKDCEITKPIFNQLENGEHLKKGLNYLSMYKILKKFGFSNENINIAIEENLYILKDFRLSLEEAEAVIKLLDDKFDIDKIIKTLYLFSKMKRTLHSFKTNEIDKQDECLAFTSKEKDNEFSTKELDNLENNSKILQKLSLAYNLNQQDVENYILHNTDLISFFNKSIFLDYLSVLGIVKLDKEIIDKKRIDFIKKLYENKIMPTNLYCYVRKLMELTESFSLDLLESLFSKYDSFSLIKEYGVLDPKINVVLKTKKIYIEKIKLETLKNMEQQNTRKE